MHKIEHPTVISGIFKEALFFKLNAVFTYDSMEFDLPIFEVNDLDPRAKQTKRYLKFKKYVTHQEASSPIEIPTNVKLFATIHFAHLVATWVGSLSLTEDGTFEMELPQSLEVNTRRQSLRLKSKKEKIFEGTLLIRSGDLHSEGFFKVKDFSKSGFGGTLYAPQEIPIYIGTSLAGAIVTSAGKVQLFGTVVQCAVTSEGQTVDGLLAYQVGAENIQKNKLKETEKNQPLEKRKFLRSNLSLPLTILSPINPNHEVRILLREASIAGFSAEIINSSDAHLLMPGLSAHVKNSSIVVEVNSIDASCVRFQIVNGSSEDRLSWLKELTIFQNPNTTGSTAISAELVNLFCESGALSSAFIKNQPKYSTVLESDLSSESNYQMLIHRWIERSKKGEIQGHSSAVRLGNNLWFLGDIAGSPLHELKITPSFLPNFFRSFREFAISQAPCPKFLLSWNLGHPYWEMFSEYVHGDGKKYVQASVVADYHRYEDSNIVAHDESLAPKFILIRADGYSDINSICEQLENNDTRLFAQSLDFNVDQFGSPAIHAIADKMKASFWREYSVLSYSGAKWLVVFSSFPTGISVNRTTDVAWAFPCVGNDISILQSPKALAAVRHYGFTRGFNIPGLLEVVNNAQLASNGTKRMQWVIAHPQVMKWFEGPS